MTLLRHEPWSLLGQLQKELERSFDLSRPEGEGAVVTSEWTPAVDIKEEKDRYVLFADLPGVKPEEIDVTMENGVLAIKGERETEAKAHREGYKRIERSYGTFYRRFTLPDSADAAGISAKSICGVLQIDIPKKAALQPKKINVTA